MTSIRDQRNANRLARLKRDTAICEQYLNGMTLEECGRLYKLRRQRIKQIVKAAGLWRPRTVTVSDRNEFLGVNLSGTDKIALKLEADRRGLSMSALTAELINHAVPRPTITEEIAEYESQIDALKEKV